MTSKDIKVALLGNSTEYYNATLYAFLAIKFADLYFPFDNYHLSLLASFTTFAAGYVLRPVAGLIFGYIGDTRGGNFAIYYSLITSAFPTFAIAFLPTYGTLGFLAPLLLVFLRVLQGMSVVGGWSGLVVYLLEKKAPHKRNLWGSIICISGYFGALTAAIAIFLSNSFIFPDYAWRSLYLIGGILSLISIYYRHKINKLNLDRTQKSSNGLVNSIKNMLSTQKTNLMAAFFMGGVTTASFNLSWIYVNSIYADKFSFATTSLAKVNIIFIFSCMIGLIPAGYLADKIGTARTINLSLSLLIIISYPSFYLINSEVIEVVILGQALLALPHLGLVACANNYLFSLFQIKERCAAIGFGYTLGTAVFGGSAPTIILSLENLLEARLLQSIYLITLGVISLYLVNNWGLPFLKRSLIKSYAGS